jgi:hypothetical protein
VGGGRRATVAGETDGADHALIPRPDRGLQSPTRTHHGVQSGEIADGVQLQQVDPVDLQPFQGTVDGRPRAVCRAFLHLGGQEDLIANAAHPRTQPKLRIAVTGRHVEVVDARR